MKFLRLIIHSKFPRCILSGIAVNTSRLFNAVQRIFTHCYLCFLPFYILLNARYRLLTRANWQVIVCRRQANMKYKVIFPLCFERLCWIKFTPLSAHYASLSTVLFALYDFFTLDYARIFHQFTSMCDPINSAFHIWYLTLLLSFQTKNITL